MKVSASVYSNKKKSLRDLVRELDEFIVDFLHMDCNDEPAVFDDIREIREFSKTPIDLHIITSDPEKYFDGIRETRPELVTFQYENLKKGWNIPSDLGCRLGLAIVSDTPVSVFEPVAARFDFILFMTTTPGKSGGTFNKENFAKIREFRKRFPDKKVHVDGGVTADISFVLRNMGVYAAVSGSYLVNSEGMGNAMHNLRSNYYVPSGTHVKDFMLGNGEVPRITESAGLMEILKSIEEFNLGFTNVVNAGGELLGLISNADVRRGILKNPGKVESLKASDMINRNPVCAHSEMLIGEMLEMIRNTGASILYLPVVGRGKKLEGVVSFTNLIKGE
ncbi:MAG: CBS domain-containing protein [Bacteroidia bacterium]|nr:CBS domain-containing protein [Bacteroidia bacterium]